MSDSLDPAFVNSSNPEIFLLGLQLIIFILLIWIIRSNVHALRFSRKPAYFYLVTKATTVHDEGNRVEAHISECHVCS